MIKVGDQVIIKYPFYHEGDNLGNRLGIVVDIQSYIMVKVYQYKETPVKCFRYDIKKI